MQADKANLLWKGMVSEGVYIKYSDALDLCYVFNATDLLASFTSRC